jgi:hypothetical protein
LETGAAPRAAPASVVQLAVRFQGLALIEMTRAMQRRIACLSE